MYDLLREVSELIFRTWLIRCDILSAVGGAGGREMGDGVVGERMEGGEGVYHSNERGYFMGRHGDRLVM